MVDKYDYYKSFLLVVFLVAGNILTETLGCSFNKFIDNNIVKYLFLFLLVWVTINIGTNATHIDNLKNSVFIFIVYILFTRSKVYIISISLTFVIILYMLHGYKKDVEGGKINKDDKIMKNINTAIKIIEIILPLIILFGFFEYMYIQYKDKGKKFNMYNFLFNIKCKKNF